MFRIMWNGMSGMAAQQEQLDAISNNLANMNTTGYKTENVGFSDLLYETLDRNGVPVTDNNHNRYTGAGVKADSWLRDVHEGDLAHSDINTNFAIDGRGYFRVTREDGSKAYERAGAFTADLNGNLVDPSGNKLDIDYSVDPNTVKFTSNNISVKKDGTVSVKNGDTITEVGKINIYDAVGDDSMASVGDSLFVPKAGVQMFVRQDSDIYQNYLEGSNVDVATEMTNMIVANRAYEMSSKSIQTADSMWNLVNNLRR